MTDPLQSMRLVVVSHVTHFRHEGRLFAYGPYSQEIDLWADLFENLTIAAPCRDQVPPGDCLPFTRRNISIAPQMEMGGETWRAKIKLALATPLLIAGLARTLRRADAIHVRCPGNLGLLGAIVAPVFSRRLVAKYAAQWPDGPNDVATSRWQKAVLRSAWWRGPVTVYGEWPNQPKHIVPFFTSLLTSTHMERARHSASRFWDGQPLQILYTGRLTKSKNVDVLLRAIAGNRRDGLDVRCAVVGEGPEETSLRGLAESLQISQAVEFTGGVEFEQVIHHLERSHVLALVSETEGWPKSIAEAMAFGLVCIGSNRGFVPKMLANSRGVAVPPRDEGALANAIGDVARNPHAYATMRHYAADWSQRFSLEGLQSAIHDLLLREWKFDTPAAGAIHRAAGGAE
jgi:glycosyltransferase involved in cell wall biosynthesis